MCYTFYMTLASTQDILYVTLAIAVLWVAVFLCWGLYELARLLHQANVIVNDARERVSRLEHALLSIKERLESSVNYLGMFASGWKTFLGMFQAREDRRERQRKKKTSDVENEE